jgi:TolB-like protein/Tfp pilus assembly protein PilF
MKRCPECRRDYFDDSLLYCLDDGSALLEGPASGRLPGDEPTTAILHHTDPHGEAATRHLIHTTDTPAAPRRSFLRLLLIVIAIAIVGLGVFFGYRYVRPGTRQISSIAVMPFSNDSGNSDIDYLADGMTDTLISSLSHLPNLTVKARSAVFRYKGQATDAKAVGRDLNAQAVLNGHVVGRGDQLTVNLELIDSQTEDVIWAGQYDRKQADLVSIQKEITRDVLSKLTPKLSGADEQKLTKTYTTNPEAYRALLQGRYFLDRTTREDTEKAIGYLQQALDLDQSCALCSADLGRAYAIQAGRAWVPEKDGFDRSRDATKRALSIDPDLAEGHAQLGRIQATYDLDLRAAEGSYRRALELAPSSASVQDGAAVLLYKLGRFDEAIALSRKALDEDPLNPAFYHNLGLTSLAAGQLDESEKAFRKALELAPQRLVSNALLAIVLMELGRVDESLATAQKEPDEVWRLWSVAIVSQRAGQKARSDEAVQKLVAAHPDGNAFQIAEVYAVRGETDKAFQWLYTAYQERDSGITHSKVDPLLASLHSDQRWAAYIRMLGFDV